MRKTDLYLLEYIQTEMSQSQIMPQKRNAVSEFDEVSRLVQCSIGHGYLWWKGLMTELLREKRPVISLHLLEQRFD